MPFPVFYGIFVVVRQDGFVRRILYVFGDVSLGKFGERPDLSITRTCRCGAKLDLRQATSYLFNYMFN